ncbi:hypothetical protein KOR34_37350 [Posidoniimonas corsicana]|uniref:Uncharacterized protein n=1 Tax=Posidoniimonas corsicana TaxID=1938618 RepID=A0A5C5V7R1_9BACT|nr:helix-turn-helix domain-containing protein [Posidoniimonas corsicana]TWT33899.1 hypothetical protein KOR34_37350 [Posidoniimonas corsicana]
MSDSTGQAGRRQTRQKHSPQQYLLPFETYRERFALLDAIDYRRITVEGKPCTRGQWKRIRTLLKVYNRLAGDRECFASVATLADRCEYSKATVSTAIREATELQLLEKTPQTRKTGNGGRAPNLTRVQWDRVAALAGSREVDSNFGEVDSNSCEVDPKNWSANKEISESTSPRGEGSSATVCTGFGLGLSDAQVDDCRRRGNLILKTVGPARRGSDDFELAAKVAILSVQHLGEAWLIDSLEALTRRTGTKKIDDPWRYWRTCLANNFDQFAKGFCGNKFNTALARTRVPADLRRSKREGGVEQPC